MPLGKTSNSDLVRIALTDPNEWVEVKQKIGVADERAIQAISLRGQRIAVGEAVTEVSLAALFESAPFATMEVAIKRWSITDPTTGREAALTVENIHSLSDADVAIISARLAELYPAPRGEEEKKDSSGSGRPLSLARAASRKSSSA